MKTEANLEPADPSPYFALGRAGLAIETDSPDAQTWFDRGCQWIHAFNHEESYRCFHRASLLDSTAAMALWGKAMSLGPNYSRPWSQIPQHERLDVLTTSHALAVEASKCVHPDADLEVALCAALLKRFPEPHQDVTNEAAQRWETNFADAMVAVQHDFPESSEVAAHAALALLMCTPWKLWNLHDGAEAAGSRSLEAAEILERQMAYDRDSGEEPHTGLHHYYVHLFEMSKEPEIALEAGRILAETAPEAGHLVHMRSHVQVLTDDFEGAIATNVASEAANQKYVDNAADSPFFTVYRSHDYHFILYSSMMTAQREVSYRAAAKMRELATSVPPGVGDARLASFMDAYRSMDVHAKIRFGDWEPLSQSSEPRWPESQAPYSNAIDTYGHGIANAVLGNLDASTRSLDRLVDMREGFSSNHWTFNNRTRDILDVAIAMLRGELSYRRGDYDVAFALLREAVAVDDGLTYTEPWAWMQPPRHALGALLLEQDRVDEAQIVYKIDLGLDPTLPRPLQRRGNVWSLHGYLETQQRSGDPAAEQTRALLEERLQNADVPLLASCLCRLNTH